MEHRLFSFKKENIYDSAPASHCWEFVLQMKQGLSQSLRIKDIYEANLQSKAWDPLSEKRFNP